MFILYYFVIIVYIDDLSPVDCLDIDDADGAPTASYNACYNSLNTDRHRWDGTSYAKDDQAAWRTAGHTGGLLFNTGTPGLNNVGNEELWPTDENSAVVERFLAEIQDV